MEEPAKESVNVVCHLIYCYTGMSLGVQIRHTRPSPSETKRYAKLVDIAGLHVMSRGTYGGGQEQIKAFLSSGN